MVALSLAEGTSIVTENVFENRFAVVDELTASEPASPRAPPRRGLGLASLTGSVVEAPDCGAAPLLPSPAWRPRA